MAVAGSGALLGFGCTAGVASTTVDGGGSDGSAFPDATPVTDGSVVFEASVDSGGGDSGSTCGALGGTYDKTCATVADCTTVARGCYCGAQPVIGIAKSASVAAQACEKQTANNCALGCANFPGRVAEDGANDVDGGTITVLCDLNKCHTVLK